MSTAGSNDESGRPPRFAGSAHRDGSTDQTGAAVVELRAVTFELRASGRLFGPIDLTLAAGEMAVVTGGSATGKSVLLELVMGAFAPTAGVVLTLGEAPAMLQVAAQTRLRRRVGHVAQRGALLTNLSLYDNLILPLAYHTRLSDAELSARAARVLAELEIGQLPAGSASLAGRALLRQVALARSLILDPELLVLDDPTDGMDAVLAAATWQRLRDLQRRRGLAILAASSHPGAAIGLADHVIALGAPASRAGLESGAARQTREASQR